MKSEYRMQLPPVRLASAEGAAREVLERARAQIGFVPNMYANMAHFPGLLETYLAGYAAFREGAGFSPVEQEVVFLVISRENGCEYCVSAHSVLADTLSGVPPEVTNAIRDRRPLPDARLQALATFTAVMARSRGLPGRADVAAFVAAGFEERHILGVVHAIAVKVLSNYTNHLFHTPLDGMFASREWEDRAT